MRTLTITLNVPISHLEGDALDAAAYGTEGEDWAPTGTDVDLNDVGPEEIANLIAGHLQFVNDELWAGSGIYATIDGDASVLSANWV